MGSLFLFQGIFPTQGSNTGLLHCRQILHHLSHQGSPRILEWVAYPFSRGSSRPRNQTRVSCIAGGFFTLEPPGKKPPWLCERTEHSGDPGWGCHRVSLVAQWVKSRPAMWESRVRSLGWEDPLEKEMATHSNILAWRIPWTEEPGGLQSMRSQGIVMTE